MDSTPLDRARAFLKRRPVHMICACGACARELSELLEVVQDEAARDALVAKEALTRFQAERGTPILRREEKSVGPTARS